MCTMCQSPALLQLLPSQAPLAGGWHSCLAERGNRFPMMIVIQIMVDKLTTTMG